MRCADELRRPEEYWIGWGKPYPKNLQGYSSHAYYSGCRWALCGPTRIVFNEGIPVKEGDDEPTCIRCKHALRLEGVLTSMTDSDNIPDPDRVRLGWLRHSDYSTWEDYARSMHKQFMRAVECVEFLSGVVQGVDPETVQRVVQDHERLDRGLVLAARMLKYRKPAVEEWDVRDSRRFA